MSVLVTGNELSTQNKKLDIYITTINPITSTASGTVSTPAVETLLIGDIDLPILFNSSTSQPNSASTWKGFNFNIDLNSSINLVSGNYLQFKLDSNDLVVNNSVKVGDTLVMKNLFVGTVSTFDFSGQYRVYSVLGATVSLDVNKNIDFVAYASNTYPVVIHNPSSSISILSNSPKLDLNKGYMINVTRINSSDDISLGSKYLVDVRDLQY